MCSLKFAFVIGMRTCMASVNMRIVSSASCTFIMGVVVGVGLHNECSGTNNANVVVQSMLDSVYAKFGIKSRY